MYIDDDGVLWSLGEPERRATSAALSEFMELGDQIEREEASITPHRDGPSRVWQYKGYPRRPGKKWKEWRKRYEVDVEE